MTDNPYLPPAPIKGAKPLRSPIPAGKRRRLAAWLGGLLLAGSIVAAGFAAWEIESILFSGPLVLVASVLLSALSLGNGPRQYLWIAGPCLGCVAASFAAINLMHWSPTQAQWPISGFIVAVALIIQPGWRLVFPTRSALALDDSHAIPTWTEDPATPVASVTRWEDTSG